MGEKMQAPELVFATGNRAKLAQMAFVIASLNSPVRLVSAREWHGERACYDEVGDSAAAIAQSGAQTLAEQLGVPVVVEDTTFHVESMGGRPGVKAGLYLIEHGRAGILKALEGVSNRNAAIVSAVAWASPQGDMQTWLTALEGKVALEERWQRGLPNWIAPSPGHPLGGGYNAIFIPRDHSRTLAEMTPEEGMEWGYREPNFCAVLAFLEERAGLKVHVR